MDAEEKDATGSEKIKKAEEIKKEPEKSEDEEDLTLADLVDTSKNYIYLILITAAVLISYYPTLHNQFVWDDNVFIVNDNSIRFVSNIPSFFTHSVEGLYRPLRTAFYALAYAFFSLKPLYYHAFAMIIHLFASLLIFYIVLKLTNSRITAALAALIFATHPAHTESISFITSSFDQMAIVFFLLSYYYYAKTTRAHKVYSIDWYYLSLLFFLLAAFTSEITLTLPLIIILHDLIFVEGSSGSSLSALKNRLKYYVPYFAILIGYLIIRFAFIGMIARDTSQNFYTYLIVLATMTKVVVIYLKVFFLPNSLAVERTVPLATSFTELAVLLSLGIIALLLAAAYLLRKRQKLITFSILFFFITLLPVSNIIPIQRVIAEAYLYLPSFGFALAASVLINYVLKRITKDRKSAALLLSVLLVLPYIYLTIDRNKVWHDDFSLWSQTVQDSPYSSKAHSNLGLLFLQQHNYEPALAEFLTSLQLNPYREEVYFNLGTLFEQTGENQKAMEAYNKSISLNPLFSDSHENLGLVYAKLNNTELALQQLKLAVSLQPANPQYHLNLGSYYSQQKQYELALDEFKIALQLNPNIAEAHFNRGIVYANQRRYAEAEFEMEQALQLNPKLIQARIMIDELRKVMEQS